MALFFYGKLGLLGLLIRYMPEITRNAAIITLALSCSSRINHPNAIPKIGVRKAKLATPDAGYIDKSHNQNTKPIATTIID